MRTLVSEIVRRIGRVLSLEWWMQDVTAACIADVAHAEGEHSASPRGAVKRARRSVDGRRRPTQRDPIHRPACSDWQALGSEAQSEAEGHSPLQNAMGLLCSCLALHVQSELSKLRQRRARYVQEWQWELLQQRLEMQRLRLRGQPWEWTGCGGFLLLVTLTNKTSATSSELVIL